MKTRLELSLNDDSTSLSPGDFHERVAEAFQANGPVVGSALPSPVNVICDRDAFVCQSLKGSARFYLIECNRGLSTAPNITVDVIIHAEEEEPGAQACVTEFCERAKRANRRSGELAIEVPRQFYVYPLLDDIPALMEDSPFYFSVTKEARWPSKVKKELLAASVTAAVSYIVGFILQSKGLFVILSGALLNLVAGAAVGVSATLLFERITCDDAVVIGIDEAVNREALRMKNSRTAETLAEYKDPTPVLRRSRKGDDDER